MVRRIFLASASEIPIWSAGGPANAAYGYDRRNRLTTIIQGSITTSKFYNDAGLLLGESYSGGTLAGYSTTNNYDLYPRKSYVAARTPLGSWYGVTSYAYDNASRLSSGTFSGAGVNYSYLANSALVGNITSQQSGVTRLTVNKTYDYLNRLSSVSAAPSAAGAVTYGYLYNDANQRVQVTLADGSFWIYEYDSLGQVKTGKRYWNDWTPVAGQQFEYACNDIGNRTSTKAGGDAAGGNLRSASYTPNTLNQYGSRTVPGAVDILGIANATATVTVAGQGAYRRGEYFQNAPAINNSSGPAYVSVTTTSTSGGSTSITGNLLLAPATESYGYDPDGNTTSDGLWTYTWDAENRLVKAESQTSVPSAARKQLLFDYDYLDRRISKTVNSWNGSNYVFQSLTRFLYDGWNLIAEFDIANNFLRSYAWGSDLSGSMQGAGGVGGLIGVVVASGTTYFPVYDANGNVTGWASAADGLAARLEYGPFGEIIRTTGPLANSIPFLFQTEYYDWETGKSYWKHRYYDPSTGRWLSRDPIGENGGPNLYGFVGNDPIRRTDRLGLDYYIYTTPGACGVKHRVLVGDDGKGNSFEIDIVPVVNNRWQSYRRFCGKGVITYTPRTGVGTNWVSGPIEKHEITTPEQDATIAANAKALDKREITYCLGVQDCRSVEDCVLWGPISQRINDEAQLLWQVILEQVKTSK